MTHLYKYVGASYLEKVLSSPSAVTLKCSYPKHFNDPFELFLTVDSRDEPEALAFYGEVIGEIPQVPTTCFSRSPDVIPMWAHYAEALTGVVVELNEEELSKEFPQSGFGDVDYQDSPDEWLTDMLQRAYMIKKPRYVYQLQRGAFSRAYYTKASAWRYERERRMLVRETETQLDDDLVLIEVPSHCVTAVIVGPRATQETKAFVRAWADAAQCTYYEVQIGRSSPQPYFQDATGATHAFDGQGIFMAQAACDSCGEPLSEEIFTCSWCRITEAHRETAARDNPYRMLERYGLLDSYIEDMHDISERGGQPRRDEPDSDA